MKRLDRYIEASTLKSLVLVASGLTALFSLLEFVDQLRDVGQGHYRVTDAFLYVLLTVPSRLLQLMPVSLLLGSLFALGNLSNGSELVAMQSIGVSERRIVGWVLKLAVPIVVILFLVAEFVIPTAQRMAQGERMSRMSTETSIKGGNGFWAQGDHQYLNVRWVDYGNVPRDIDIYAFTDDGELQSFIHADSAKIVSADTWLLNGVVRTQLLTPEAQTEHLATLPWAAFLRPPQVQLLILPPDSMPPIELYRYIHELKRQNHQTARLEQAFWTKVSIPISMAAMVLVSAPFVFGPPRARSAGQRIAIGAGVGIVFSLTQQIISLGSLLLDLSPALAAMAPSVLLMAFAYYLSRRRAS
ncbi:MAG: lptG [Rhodospirillales bacterium]|nr:lptG [Rhodospirillales bacterium]